MLCNHNIVFIQLFINRFWLLHKPISPVANFSVTLQFRSNFFAFMNGWEGAKFIIPLIFLHGSLTLRLKLNEYKMGNILGLLNTWLGILLVCEERDCLFCVHFGETHEWAITPLSGAQVFRVASIKGCSCSLGPLFFSCLCLSFCISFCIAPIGLDTGPNILLSARPLKTPQGNQHSQITAPWRHFWGFWLVETWLLRHVMLLSGCWLVQKLHWLSWVFQCE